MSDFKSLTPWGPRTSFINMFGLSYDPVTSNKTLVLDFLWPSVAFFLQEKRFIICRSRSGCVCVCACLLSMCTCCEYGHAVCVSILSTCAYCMLHVLSMFMLYMPACCLCVRLSMGACCTYVDAVHVHILCVCMRARAHVCTQVLAVFACKLSVGASVNECMLYVCVQCPCAHALFVHMHARCMCLLYRDWQDKDYLQRKVLLKYETNI